MKIKNKIARALLFFLARPKLQNLNKIMIKLLLRCMGYNNSPEPHSNGELNFIKLLSRHNIKICIDIGANDGRYAKLILDNTSATIYSLEPNLAPFNKLKSLIKGAYAPRLKAFNYAIGAEDGYLTLNYSDEHTELATVCGDVNEVPYLTKLNTKSVIVESLRLDSFCNKYLSIEEAEIDFLKIDVEGFEYEVLIGSLEILEKSPPKFIQIEYNWHQLFRGITMYKIYSLLDKYSLYQLLPSGELGIRDPKDPLSNLYMYTNFIFVRKDIEILN